MKKKRILCLPADTSSHGPIRTKRGGGMIWKNHSGPLFCFCSFLRAVFRFLSLLQRQSPWLHMPLFLKKKDGMETSWKFILRQMILRASCLKLLPWRIKSVLVITQRIGSILTQNISIISSDTSSGTPSAIMRLGCLSGHRLPLKYPFSIPLETRAMRWSSHLCSFRKFFLKPRSQLPLIKVIFLA